jgi:hypothetical protein
MTLLPCKAILKLLQFEYHFARKDFTALCRTVRNHPLKSKTAPPNALENVCTAVDIACIWYWKQVLCLQRSAAITCLLRELGVPAQLVIGAQQIPFRAHAWVEVRGNVIHERSDVHAIFAVLDRL